jgi:hypothetical protein
VREKKKGGGDRREFGGGLVRRVRGRVVVHEVAVGTRAKKEFSPLNYDGRLIHLVLCIYIIYIYI